MCVVDGFINVNNRCDICFINRFRYEWLFNEGICKKYWGFKNRFFLFLF